MIRKYFYKFIIVEEKKVIIKMVKYRVWNDYAKREVTAFTRELNTYGFGENGIGEELLYPIWLNDESGGKQETNLATYLIKYIEFEKTDVKIAKVQDKEGFLIFIYSNKSKILNFAIIVSSMLAGGLLKAIGFCGKLL